MKFRFFERDPEKNEAELERERHIVEARQALDAININLDEIAASMSAEEVHDLNRKIANLHQELPPHDLSDATYLTLGEQVPIPDFSTEEEIIPYINSLSPRAKELFVRTIEEYISALDIGEKFREYDKEHWQEVFQRRINSGVTPFGDERNLIKDIFLKQGIDLEHPTEGDINAYFQGLEYTAGSIGSELYRRKKKDFEDIGLSTQSIVEIMLYRLLGEEQYQRSNKKFDRESYRQRLEEIKGKINL